jgi:hypothetical protein
MKIVADALEIGLKFPMAIVGLDLAEVGVSLGRQLLDDLIRRHPICSRLVGMGKAGNRHGRRHCDGDISYFHPMISLQRIGSHKNSRSPSGFLMLRRHASARPITQGERHRSFATAATLREQLRILAAATDRAVAADQTHSLHRRPGQYPAP